MSLLSRLFRKAPSPSRGSVSAPQAAVSKAVEKAQPKPNEADRARAAAAQEHALQLAIEAGDVQTVSRLVVAGLSTRIRQAAADAIDDPGVLRQLIRDVRGGKDKQVYRILTTKRDALLDQARKQEQLRAELSEASGDLERHSQRAYDALYRSRLEQFEIRWGGLAAQADAQLCGRVQQWIDRSRAVIDEHLRHAAEQAAREQAAASAVAQAQRLREQEAEIAAAAAAQDTLMLDEQKRALASEREAQQQAVREIVELIRKARGALRDGSSSRAAGLRRSIEDHLPSAAELPANLVSQLQLLDKQLDELKDWKNFSVTPKRAELIEEMESLIGSSLDPLVLADSIKRLKQEWRTLGKGAGENLESDGQRFQDAAKKAYQPCSEYFAAEALVRQENLQRRESLIARLTALEAETSWEQADWRAVIHALRETKQEWRGYAPVDRQAGKPSEAAFAAITSRLQGRLDAEYARNVQQKESLIHRAQALLGSDDSRKAIDAIKGLQQEWRAVGPVPREVDQRLWGEFRKHSDAVFQKREQESAAYKAGLEQARTQAVALCEQVEKLAALEGPELLACAGTLVELRGAFDALGELPRAEARELRHRLDRGMDLYQQSVSRQRARDAERAWDDLFRAASPVRAYRLAVVQGADAARLETLKAAAEACIASVLRWPKGGLEALKNGLAQEPGADLAANQTALRMLCIRAEILTDTPTPAEDQDLRRDYQLQRLAQRMGQGLRADDAGLDTLAIEWVGAGPVEDLAYEPLLLRFRRCRDAGRSKPGAAKS